MWHFESHDKSRNASLGSNLIASWKTGSIYFVVGIVQHGLGLTPIVDRFMKSIRRDLAGVQMK